MDGFRSAQANKYVWNASSVPAVITGNRVANQPSAACVEVTHLAAGERETQKGQWQPCGRQRRERTEIGGDAGFLGWSEKGCLKMWHVTRELKAARQ